MKHYDVCVLGFWYATNYGSLLNGYAIYRILKKMGKSVLMLQKPNSSCCDPELYCGHNIRFIEQFYSKDSISNFYDSSNLDELNNLCDCFCAGSDQIWNYPLSFGEIMYLPFVSNDKKRISIATSFGEIKQNFPNDSVSRLAKYFSNFSKISVREQFGKTILKEKFGIESDCVLEPTFCIDKQIYENIISSSHFHENDYVLAYILNPTEEKLKFLKITETKLNKKIVVIADGDLTSKYAPWSNKKYVKMFPNVYCDIDVSDFLKAFKSASYVITDSFHGSVFSIIYNKQFITFCNYCRGAERFYDLLDKFKLSWRLMEKGDDLRKYKLLLRKKIKYKNVNKKINEEKDKTLRWINTAINC